MGLDALIEQYRGGAQTLRQAVAGMSPEQLRARPVPGKWSTLEVLCHLADFDLVYADRLKRVIVEQEPTMFGGDPDQFAARLSYEARDPQEEIELVDLIRRQVTRVLRTLQPEDFQRRGLHSERGPMTLEALLKAIAGHIPHHARFIEEKRRTLGV